MESVNGGIHGVVAVGDSLLTGYGLALGGVSCLSWGGWLAWALGTCLTQHAVNGATTPQVARDQLPLLRGRYRLGVTWLGANDLGRLDPDRFEREVAAVCAALQSCCETVAVATLPRSLRGAGSSWRHEAAVRDEANARIRQVADATGVVLVELAEALVGPWSVAPDRHHPTSIGHLEAAHCAATALDAAHLRFARHLPDLAAVQVPKTERRLYDVAVTDRLRGAWDTLKHLRDDRVLTRAVAP